MKHNNVSEHARNTFSLTSDKRLATVEDRSKEVLRILKEKGIPAILEMVPGTHFSPIEPRFNKALAFLVEGE